MKESNWKIKKFNVGDIVLKNQTISIFENRNYLWCTELFKVSKVLETKPLTYRLRDKKDDKILSGFYEYQLQKFRNNGM